MVKIRTVRLCGQLRPEILIVMRDGRKAQPLVPILKDWVHSFIGVYDEFPGYPPPKMNFPRMTTTTNCLVASCIPKMSVQQAMNQSLPSIQFWVDLVDGASDNFAKVSGAIAAQYGKTFPRIRVHSRMNPTSDWLGQFLEQAKGRPANQRVLAHYCAPGCAGTVDLDEFSEVLKNRSLLNTTAFVFECDRCGSLRECFEALGSDIDTFAFFACDKNETLPRSNDLPIDLFSSCLVSPARTALLWHSRRYYCFRNGPLKPLSLSFVEEMGGCESFDEIFSHIQVALKHTVEAMAFEVLDSDSFMRLFRTDPVIAQLNVHFVLACRIMDFFGVHPRSYPELPSLVKHRLWNVFDLRLDAELFRLQQGNPDVMEFETFLQKTVISLQTISEVSPLTNSFSPQISFITSALTSSRKETYEMACSVLARFLDRSPDSIRSALHFPIVPQLFRLLKMQVTTPALLFCLCKVICYEPAVRDMGASFLLQIAIPLLRTESVLLALILCVLFIRNSSSYAMNFLQLKGISYVMPLLLNADSRVRLWALLLLSVFVPSIKDVGVRERIFEQMKSIGTDSSDEKAALYYCLSRFLINFDSPIQERILEFLLSEEHHMCHVVRCQILSGLSFFLEKRPQALTDPTTELETLVRSRFVRLSKDPHPMVSKMAAAIAEGLDRAHEKLAKQTQILDGYCAIILTQVYEDLMAGDTEESYPRKEKSKPFSPPVREKKALPTMSVTAIYTHPTAITSNLEQFPLVPLNQLAFGDDCGKINVKACGGVDVIKTFKMGRSPVSCVRYLSNFSYPLLTASDVLGNFVAFSLSSPVPNPVSAFQLFDERESFNTSNVMFDIDPFHGRLAAYRPRISNHVCLFDIRAGKRLQPLEFEDARISAARMLLGTSNVGVLSEQKFQLFDLRVNEATISIDLKRNGIDFRVIDPAMLSFLVCSRDGHLETLDLRADCDVNLQCYGRVEACSFDVHSLYHLAVVGHSHGITMFDMALQRSAAVTGSRKWFSSQAPIRRVSSVVFDRNSHVSLSACHDETNISTMIEVFETE